MGNTEQNLKREKMLHFESISESSFDESDSVSLSIDSAKQNKKQMSVSSPKNKKNKRNSPSIKKQETNPDLPEQNQDLK